MGNRFHRTSPPDPGHPFHRSTPPQGVRFTPNVVDNLAAGDSSAVRLGARTGIILILLSACWPLLAVLDRPGRAAGAGAGDRHLAGAIWDSRKRGIHFPVALMTWASASPR
jgi:hypothetical protein